MAPWCHHRIPGGRRAWRFPPTSASQRAPVPFRGGRCSTAGRWRRRRSLSARSSPPANEFARSGWAVFAIDYRPDASPPPPIVLEDSTEAVNAVRKLPFLDPHRVGLMEAAGAAEWCPACSRGSTARVPSFCAPAGLDLIEIKKAAVRGEEVIGVLKKMVANLEQQGGVTTEEIAKDPARYGYSSALTEVAQARCPVFLISGRNDPASPHSVVDVYLKELRAAGKSADAYLPDNGPHGFYFAHPDIPETHEAARCAAAFFQRCFQVQRRMGMPMNDVTAHPLRHRTGPSRGIRAAPAPGLRRAEEVSSATPGPGEAWPDPSGHGAGT